MPPACMRREVFSASCEIAFVLNFINVRLSIPARLALIGALFIVPIVFLTFIFLQQSSGDISFAEKEIAGTRYLIEIWPRFANSSLTGIVSQSEIQNRAQFDSLFNTAEASNAFVTAKDLSSELDAGKTLIGAVADNSNLTLDPDLDSFYAMDAATVRIPGIATAAVALGQAIAEPSTNAARIVHVAFAVDHLQTSSDDAASSLASAIKGNAAGDTAKALSAPTAALKAAADSLLEQGRAVLDGREAQGVGASQAALLTQIDATWTPTNAELGRLLQVRVDGFYHKITVNLAFAGLFMIVATVLSFTIALGLAGRLSRLLAVMDRLVANDLSAEIPHLSDVNETGRIAKTLSAFKQTLIERSKLQSEKALAEQLATERRQNEEARAATLRRQALVVKAVAETLGSLARSDLTVSLTEPFPEDFEQLRTDLNGATEQLQKAMVEIAAMAQSVHTGSGEITVAVGDLQARTEQQAAGLEETAAALDEITATVKKSAEGAAHAREIVAATDDNAKRSVAVVAQAVEAMEGIAKAAQQISPIIGLMDEIAFQTNLLALNAGVEAARAGDAGRGFAVVASEVRALAQRSAGAAKEIKVLISQSALQVDRGVQLVAETGSSLELIMAQVAEINTVVSEIANGAKEQATGLEEINIAINQMDQMTQQNAAMVEESRAASDSLSNQAEQLTNLISRFRIIAPDPRNFAQQESRSAPPALAPDQNGPRAAESRAGARRAA
jgi:methyl-accepting chemotaxis protein